MRAWDSKVIPETGLEILIYLLATCLRILIYLTSQKKNGEWKIQRRQGKKLNQRYQAYELVKRAKDAGMPKQELDLIKIRLGIVSTDTDDESKILKELALKKTIRQTVTPRL